MPGGFTDRVRATGFGLAARFLFGLPDRVLSAIFGDPPGSAAGLRPDAWALCRIAELIEAGSSPDDHLAMRADTDELAQVVSDRTPLPVDTRDLDLSPGRHSLPARLYEPAGAVKPGPLLLWFHGGGWTVGSIDSHDFSCRRLAHNTGARVLSVDYRLAPEHPFPAAPDDALLAWNAVTADPALLGSAPGRIAVGGDSAGANLAAVLCQDLRSAGRPQPAFQVLVYPVAEIGFPGESVEKFATGFYLTRDRIDFYDGCYAPGPEQGDVRVSPLGAESFEGLAPAYVNTCLADPLRDEGELYAKNLMEAGVETRLDRFPLVHAWFNQTLLRSSRTAHEVLAARIRKMFEDSVSDGS